MIRRLGARLQKRTTLLGGVAVVCLAGCLGGAHPEPPTVEPRPSADAGGVTSFDAGGAPVDAGPMTPPPTRTDLDSDFAATPGVAESAGWRWPFWPLPWASDHDAGLPAADGGVGTVDAGDETLDAGADDAPDADTSADAGTDDAPDADTSADLGTDDAPDADTSADLGADSADAGTDQDAGADTDAGGEVEPGDGG